MSHFHHNPFEIFASPEQEPFPLQNGSQSNLEATYPLKKYKIKQRKIKKIKNYGRGANHPTFFLRHFYTELRNSPTQQASAQSLVFADFPELFEEMLEEAQTSSCRNKFTTKDLEGVFGVGETAKQRRRSYLNSKLFFRMISEEGLEIIMGRSKCSSVLNHLISIEKYSSRLGHPELTKRIEFQ